MTSPLVPFFPAQHFEHDLLELRQFVKLDDAFAIQLHLAVFQVRVFLEYHDLRLQGQLMSHTNDLARSAQKPEQRI